MSKLEGIKEWFKQDDLSREEITWLIAEVERLQGENKYIAQFSPREVIVNIAQCCADIAGKTSKDAKLGIKTEFDIWE